MCFGLLPEDASHIVVGPTKPRKFGADIGVHLFLAHDEVTIVGVWDKRQNVVEAISCRLSLDDPRVRLVEAPSRRSESSS
jgi:hypothetical protein